VHRLPTITTTGGAVVRHPSGVEHHSFFLPSGRDRVYATLYAPPSAPRFGVLLCPTWGIDARMMLEWTHRLAHRLATSGIATVVPCWPGTEESEGAMDDVTLDRLVEAGVDVAAAAEDRRGVPAWGVAGLGVGAAAASLIAPKIDATRIALIQPSLDLIATFAEAERASRRGRLDNDPLAAWSFGYPTPPGLRRHDDTERIRGALAAFGGSGAVVRYRRPDQGVDVPGFRTVVVWGDWRRPARLDHGPLAVATTRWLRRSRRRSR
jgi:hypothetical protein